MSKLTPIQRSVYNAYKSRYKILLSQAFSNFQYLSKCDPRMVCYNLSCVTTIPIKKLQDFTNGNQLPNVVEMMQILDACKIRTNYFCGKDSDPMPYVSSSLI